jgi:hypothetical protein
MQDAIRTCGQIASTPVDELITNNGEDGKYQVIIIVFPKG